MRRGRGMELVGCLAIVVAAVFCAPALAAPNSSEKRPATILPNSGLDPFQASEDYRPALARMLSEEAALRVRIESLSDHTAILPPDPVETSVELREAKRRLSEAELGEEFLRTRIQQQQATRAGVVFPQAQITFL